MQDMRVVRPWARRLSAAVTLGGLILSGSLAQAQMSIPGTFAVSPSGAATYTLPIDLPPGLGGMAPQLTLVYNSQAGNGLLGVGWSLSGLSSITRCPRTLAQDGARGVVDYTTSDRYCLDGQRLMAISGLDGASGTEYRTEIDGASKIVSSAETGATGGPGSFIVWTKAGLKMEYGKTADSRIEAQGKTAVAVWALNKVSDAKGNYYTVSYVEDNAIGQFYPKQIDYTANAGKSTATPPVPAIAATNRIVFGYSENTSGVPAERPDPIVAYRGGAKSTLKVRLAELSIQSPAANSVAKYSLTYEATPSNAPPTSLLASVTRCGASTDCLLPIVFSNTPVTTQPWGSANVNYALPDFMSGDGAPDTGDMLIDLNGDGLPDMARASWYLPWEYQNSAYLNTAAGWVSSVAYKLPDFLSAVNKRLGTRLIDINGDGLPDFVQARTGALSLNGVWLNTGSGWATSPVARFNLPDFLPGEDQPENGTHFIDLDGDGLVDFVRAKRINGVTTSTTWLNTGTAWSVSTAYTLPDVLAENHVRLGSTLIDLDGDGLPEFLQSTATSKNVWRNTGSGWIAAPGFNLPEYLPSGSQNNGAEVVDLNGDGLPDLVRRYWGGSSAQYTASYLNTGAGWIAAPQYNLPDFLAADGARLGNQIVDMNGDGLPDFLQARWLNAGSQLRSAWLNTGNGWVLATQYITPEYLSGEGAGNIATKLQDINGDGIPDFLRARWFNGSSYVKDTWINASARQLVTRFDNGMGKHIGVIYEALPRLTADADAHYVREVASSPRSIVAAPPLPVVMRVVRKRDSGNSTNVNITLYDYGNLLIKTAPAERGWAGFQWQASRETIAGTEVTNKTYYRQDWPYIGLPYKEGTSLAGGAFGSMSLSETLYSFLASTGNGAMLVSTTCADAAATGLAASCAASSVAAGKRYLIYPRQIDTRSNDVTATGAIGAALPRSQIRNENVDLYGNVGQVTTQTLSPTGAATDYSKTVTNTYAPADTVNWILGRLTKSTVTSTGPSVPSPVTPGSGTLPVAPPP